jgi:hypothetical protein
VAASATRGGRPGDGWEASDRELGFGTRGSEAICGWDGCFQPPERRNDHCRAVCKGGNWPETREYGAGKRPGGGVLQRLGDPDAGLRGSLFIHQRCGRLAETLPGLEHDPNRPEDVLKVDADEDGGGGDEVADDRAEEVARAVRGGCGLDPNSAAWTSRCQQSHCGLSIQLSGLQSAYAALIAEAMCGRF